MAILVTLPFILLASAKAADGRVDFRHNYYPHANTYLGEHSSRWGHKSKHEDAYASPTSLVPVAATSTRAMDTAKTVDGIALASQQAPLADYDKTVITHHNAHRDNHSAPALSWDAGLAATAERIASSCVYAHDT